MIPQVAKNFLNSEKGIMALVLLIGATVLTAMGTMSIEAWQSYSIWIFGIYTSGKSIQGAAAHLAGGSAGGSSAGGEIAPETDDVPEEGVADSDASAESADGQT